MVFIAVGTPPDEKGRADLRYVEEVAKSIGQTMNRYLVVVTKSTVPVGTGQLVHKIIEENQEEPCAFDVASNPEFLREGSAIEDFMRPNRVVIGAESEQAIAILQDLYSPLFLIETPFVITNVATAEMIKYASNAFLATKISFINEMANICEKVGADVHKVAKGMGLDKRIGSKFLHPGPGFVPVTRKSHPHNDCSLEARLEKNHAARRYRPLYRPPLVQPSPKENNRKTHQPARHPKWLSRNRFLSWWMIFQCLRLVRKI